MCNTKELAHPTSGKMTKLYSFDLTKCLKHFAAKYERIKKHLAKKYVEMNRGMILETQKTQPSLRVLKQEAKGVVKSEIIKTEVKSESAAADQTQTNEAEINVADYEGMHEVMAMGVVADELPNNCVEPFLKYIKEHHAGESVFNSLNGVHVKSE